VAAAYSSEFTFVNGISLEADFTDVNKEFNLPENDTRPMSIVFYADTDNRALCGDIAYTNPDATTAICTVVETNAGTNAGTETETNAGTNAGTETGTNAGTETGTNAGTNAGTETGTNAGTETGTNAGTNAGTETGTDAGTDAGTDDDETDSANVKIYSSILLSVLVAMLI